MFERIRKDTDFPIEPHILKRIETALRNASNFLVLPIEHEAFNYTLSRLHSINDNNYIIIDGERCNLPDMNQLMETTTNPYDLIEIYRHTVNNIISEAKHYIVFMFERICNGRSLYDWLIIIPRDGKYYKVGAVEGNLHEPGTYRIELSHAVMDELRQTFPASLILTYIHILMKQYFESNLVTTA